MSDVVYALNKDMVSLLDYFNGDKTFGEDDENRILSNMSQAIAEIERLRGGWMPIDTAPKDGSHILLLIEAGVIEGYWMDKIDDAPDDPGCDAGWASIDAWVWPGRSFGNKSYMYEAMNQPTHWIPLPQPPQEPK